MQRYFLQVARVNGTHLFRKEVLTVPKENFTITAIENIGEVMGVEDQKISGAVIVGVKSFELAIPAKER